MNPSSRDLQSNLSFRLFAVTLLSITIEAILIVIRIAPGIMPLLDSGFLALRVFEYGLWGVLFVAASVSLNIIIFRKRWFVPQWILIPVLISYIVLECVYNSSRLMTQIATASPPLFTTIFVFQDIFLHLAAVTLGAHYVTYMALKRAGNGN